VKPGVSIVSDNTKAISAAIRKMAETQVLVGIPSEKTSRSGPITNAALGYIHNYGAPEANIPARPFMEPGIAEAEPENLRRMQHIATAALEGRSDAVENGFIAIGLRTAAAIKRRFALGIPPPLKPSTLAARRRRGRSGTTPLIDTGQLRNAISFVIRRT